MIKQGFQHYSKTVGKCFTILASHTGKPPNLEQKANWKVVISLELLSVSNYMDCDMFVSICATWNELYSLFVYKKCLVLDMLKTIWITWNYLNCQKAIVGSGHVWIYLCNLRWFVFSICKQLLVLDMLKSINLFG